MMLKISVFVLLFGLAAAAAAVARKDSGPTTIKVEPVSSTVVNVLFNQHKTVNSYYVTITPMNFPDIKIFETTVRKSAKRADGYYYVHVDGLQANEKYVVTVYNERKMTIISSVTFTTSCDKYLFQCDGPGDEGDAPQQICLEADKLCNGNEDCIDGSDESQNNDGTCANVLLGKPKQSFWWEVVDKLGDWAGIN